MTVLKQKRGEGYIDVAVTIMLVAFVLVFSVNMVSLVALNQNMKIVADQLVEYVSQKGTVAISDYAEDLRGKTGIDFAYSFGDSVLYDAGGRVQLGDAIVCHVEYQVEMIGFGNAVHGIRVGASASGISRVYWK